MKTRTLDGASPVEQSFVYESTVTFIKETQQKQRQKCNVNKRAQYLI